MTFAADDGDFYDSVVDAINLFGMTGGFDALWRRMKDNATSLEVKLALAHSFDGCIEQLTLPCLEKVSRTKHLPPLCQRSCRCEKGETVAAAPVSAHSHRGFLFTTNSTRCLCILT